MMDTSSSVPSNSMFFLNVEEHEANIRLDAYLGKQFPAYSRTFLKNLILEKCVSSNGTILSKPGLCVKPSMTIAVHFPPQKPLSHNPDAHRLAIKELPIRVIHEHQDFLIIYKPPFVSMHACHTQDATPTVVDWLVLHYQEIKEVGVADRPGIVHRLDKDTSGLVIIARTNRAHIIFSKLFKERGIHKIYHAIVSGHPPSTGTIDFPIGRHPVLRHKMSHQTPLHMPRRESLTHYKVLEYLPAAALIETHPVTGRTHQIRVHCNGLGHPLIGDTVYGASSRLINRQALHAFSISFTFLNEPFYFSYPIPSDFQSALAFLRLQG